MLFNSVDFALFFSVVFALYWGAPKSLRNHVLLAASYVFYGRWDWRFLLLLIASSAVDFAVGLGLGRTTDAGRRKLLLAVSIIVNVGLLGFFKYANFFLDNLAAAFTFFGAAAPIRGLEIVLPVGISFYTFQKLSYTIDVYRQKVPPSRDLLQFCTYVAFFPLLLSGPIERATNLLRQLGEPKDFEYERGADGLRQIAWGLFKKVVIADNCAEIVNASFNANPGDQSGSTLLLAAVLYGVQIYGDFSGYSDMAIGTARLLGLDLIQNFAYPYFSRDIAEFWRRWHISLTSWFRDYLYIPLGGNRGSRLSKIRNVMIIFLVSGFWHGASWTFIIWGFLHALFFLPLLLRDQNRRHIDDIVGALPTLAELGRMVMTFALVDVAWIFFRAETFAGALAFIAGMVDPSLFSKPDVIPLKVLALVMGMFAIEWLNRRKLHGLALADWSLPTFARWTGYVVLVSLIVYFGGTSETFIYFQF